MAKVLHLNTGETEVLVREREDFGRLLRERLGEDAEGFYRGLLRQLRDAEREVEDLLREKETEAELREEEDCEY